MCLKSPHRLRSTWGPFSRYFSGSHVCQTCDGSTTWSSTLMIFGSSSIGAKATAGFDADVSFTAGRGSGPRPRSRSGRSFLEIVAQTGERHLLDVPAAVVLLVLLVVVAGAVELASVGPPQTVLHCPDSGGCCRRRQLDLRHVPVMHGEDIFEDLPE